MNSTELRQLDAWIAENVMGFSTLCKRMPDGKISDFIIGDGSRFCPTIDPAAAMEVLKKCARKSCPLIQHGANEVYYISSMVAKSEAPTLELAICLFAKKLFEK